MNKEMNLLDKIRTAFDTEDCCMECLLNEITRLIFEDTSYDEEIKQKMLATINNNKMSDRQKLGFITSLINEHIER